MKQKKHAGEENKDKMNEELAMVYAKEKINPVATILPVFVQLPIFVSLFNAIKQLSTEDVHF